MWPKAGRHRIDIDDRIKQSVAYDNIQADTKLDDLIMLYDEKSIFLFEKPKAKRIIRKI